jgi:stage III sporulation protein SpoIIIAA
MDEHTGEMDELEILLSYLPAKIRRYIDPPASDGLVEIALDLKRSVQLRYASGPPETLPCTVEPEDIEYVVRLVGMFRGDNRAGIPRTLHRVSAIKDRYGDITGLTIRVGRHLPGVAEPLTGLLERANSLLVLGPPGSGKTTLLRDICRILSESRRVVVVDTSNEIGGDGEPPHPAIGAARRLQVPSKASQYELMLEAVQNHNPEVVIIDEIGTRKEAESASTIARRGVTLIATAHGNTLKDLLENPELDILVGGIKTVPQVEATEILTEVVGEAAAGRRLARERVMSPVFDLAVELYRDEERTMVVRDVRTAVDALLAGQQLPVPLLVSERVYREIKRNTPLIEFVFRYIRQRGGRPDPWAEQLAGLLFSREAQGWS